MPILTLIDALRIQDFVFASNRLRDIVVGSGMVADATDTAQLAELAGGGRVVYAAGGNALLHFDNDEQAKTFVGRYSRHIIENVSGLELEAAHVAFETGGMYKAFREVQERLRVRKLGRHGSGATLGLSVTAECAQTRAVATYRAPREGGGEVALSAATGRRRLAAKKALDRETLVDVPRVPNVQFRFPRELDALGRSSGDTSLLGVVHVDGNGVGRRISSWLRAHRASDDRTLEDALAGLSAEIDNVGETAWQGVVGRVRDAIYPRDPDGPDAPLLCSLALGQRFPLATAVKHGKRVAYLPVRRILLGGDDLTFVCDGRLALDLARVALTAFRDTPVPSLGDARLGACAGVTIMHSHAPFSRAYDLAEALCQHAKRWLRERDTPDGYAIDWHVGTSAPLESLEELRERQYTVPGYKLTMRPYALDQPMDGVSFAWLDDRVLGSAAGTDATSGFQSEFWQRRRNKIKELRALVRGGPTRVGQARKAWAVTAEITALPAGLHLPAGPHDEEGFKSRAGEDKQVTPLLDAIELLDVHYPLHP